MKINTLNRLENLERHVKARPLGTAAKLAAFLGPVTDLGEAVARLLDSSDPRRRRIGELLQTAKERYDKAKS